MKFRVIWKPPVLNELATIWMAVTDRTAVTQAMEELDHLLERDPQHAGESRSGTQRIAFAFPLAVRFEIVQDDLEVNILAVWLTKRV